MAQMIIFKVQITFTYYHCSISGQSNSQFIKTSLIFFNGLINKVNYFDIKNSLISGNRLPWQCGISGNIPHQSRMGDMPNEQDHAAGHPQDGNSRMSS